MERGSKVGVGLILMIFIILISLISFTPKIQNNSLGNDSINFLSNVNQNCKTFCNTYAGMGYDHVNELGECHCWKNTLTIYGNHSYVTNRTQNYGIINNFYKKK